MADYRDDDAVFVGVKERTLLGFDHYVVLEVFGGDISERVLVEDDHVVNESGEQPHLIRGDDPPGPAKVRRQGPCPILVTDRDGAPVSDYQVATAAFGPSREPGFTASSTFLTAVEHPLRWSSDWRIWAGLLAAAAILLGWRRTRATPD